MTTSAALPAIAGGGFSIPPGVFGASVGAVKQLFITIALGAATVLSGAIEPASISALSKIVYNLFLPSFLFCSVIKTVTTYGVSPQLLLMPLFATLQISVGLLVSRFVVLPLLRINPKSDRGRELTLCTSFHNPGVLPLLFFDALFRAPYPDAAVMPQLAAFVSFYLMGYTPLFWSVGKGIITGGGGGGGGSSSSEKENLSAVKRVVGAAKAVFGAFSPPPVRGALFGLFVAVTPLKSLLLTDTAPLSKVSWTPRLLSLSRSLLIDRPVFRCCCCRLLAALLMTTRPEPSWQNPPSWP